MRRLERQAGDRVRLSMLAVCAGDETAKSELSFRILSGCSPISQKPTISAVSPPCVFRITAYLRRHRRVVRRPMRDGGSCVFQVGIPSIRRECILCR